MGTKRMEEGGGRGERSGAQRGAVQGNSEVETQQQLSHRKGSHTAPALAQRRPFVVNCMREILDSGNPYATATHVLNVLLSVG